MPESVQHVWQHLFGGVKTAEVVEPAGFFWIFGAPLLFYGIWQLLYFLIVQVHPAGIWLL